MNPKLEKLTELQKLFKDCTKCKKSLTETKVWGHGNPDTKIAVIGEGPGADEAEKGIPFIGAVGKLLDKILLAINIKREDIYLTNAVICRTSITNRTPTQTELDNCRVRLFKELSVIEPAVTLLVGSVALNTIFGLDYKIMKYHGQWLTTLTPPCYFYFPIVHPAWILHSSTEGEMKLRKKLMWQDIKKFRDDLELFKSTKYYKE